MTPCAAPFTGTEAWHPSDADQEFPVQCPRTRRGCGELHTRARYAYSLQRKISMTAGGHCVAIMLNPSCPDLGNVMFGKIRNLCDEAGPAINTITFLNLFAYRERHLRDTTEQDVQVLATRNREAAARVLDTANEVIVAWGVNPPTARLASVWAAEASWAASR